MSYEDLLEEADHTGLIVKEKPLLNNDGRINGNKIAIRQDIPTLAKKADVLAEELGHYHTSVGHIIDQQSADDIKQERRARLWAYNKQIGLSGIVSAYKAHCTNANEIADYLNVSEDFLLEALECYRQIYGRSESIDNYVVQFEPFLQVYEYFVV